MGSDTNFNLERGVALFLRRAPLIALCLIAVAAASYGLSKRQTRRYTASASLVFDNNQLNLQAAGLQAVGTSGNQQPQQQTNLKLVQLGDMAARTAAQLGGGLTESSIRKNLSVTSQGESNIVDVAATATSPRLAARIANTYTALFVAEQQSSNHAYYAAALALVNKQLAALSPRERLTTAGVALENRAQSLGVLAELKNGNVQIAQVASVPTGPSSPRTARNTVLGAILGLLLGVGVAFLLERLDRHLREPRDLEAVYGLPLLGVIPESRVLSRSDRAQAEPRGPLPAGEAEAFHLIRAHLRYFNVDRQLHTLMVVSAAPGDGKTTVARHLAAAAATMGSRVLLMEADLRRPTIAQQLSIRPGPGLADVLIDAASLGDAIQSVELPMPSERRSRGRTLDVLTSGAVPPPNPGELIESHAMQAVLASVKSLYDLVVIDTPPLTAVSDAFPLLHRIDGVIVVGRIGRNRRDVAQRLHETLIGAGAPLLGVVANGYKSGALGAYGYAYEYSPPAARSTAAEPPGAAASSVEVRVGDDATSRA